MSDDLQSLLDEARATNQRLNRRVQVLESESAKEDRRSGLRDAQQRNRWLMDRMKDFHDFERMMAAHNELKQCYEAAAKVLGLPYGKYHSVMDSRQDQTSQFTSMVRTRPVVWANVFPNYPKGGVVSYPVVETVQKALALVPPQTTVKKRRWWQNL